MICPCTICHSQCRCSGDAVLSRGPVCPSRAHWYGTSAYPTVEGRNQSWSWLMTFVESVANATTDDVLDWEIFLERVTDDSAMTLDSVRFSGALLSDPEKDLERTQNMRKWAMDRVECFTKLCDAKTEAKTSLRNHPPAFTGHIVFLNFRDVDIYDIERTLKGILRSPYIITSCTADFPISPHEEDTGLALYDLLNKMFFELDWVPILSDISRCVSAKSGPCHFWIIWKAWNSGAKPSYIPPAGTGSAEFEIQRLSALVTHPQSDTCRRRQRIGGTWEEFGFIDGQWTVCLDPLEKSMASGSCLVYSFGVGKDWSFDDAMHALGCRVYSFDPSIKTASYQRNRHHYFYDWGLVTGGARHPRWMLLSYDDIRRRLNHDDQRVTVLKMDVEGAEWMFLNATNISHRLAEVDQLVLEIHTPRYADWRKGVKWRSLLLHNIEKNGFVLFNSRINPLGGDLRAYSHKKFFQNSKQILVELSYMRCAG
ncbi:uncharacterized protein LOC129602254 isoform X2 [Paramacrobiotus metropolitanus]|nr:uncharacterized protein LOC129602254 isoform X2 [Paramacrobiotus metropolitanus]